MNIEGSTLTKGKADYWFCDPPYNESDLFICISGFDVLFGVTPQKIRLHWTDKWSKYVVLISNPRNLVTCDCIVNINDIKGLNKPTGIYPYLYHEIENAIKVHQRIKKDPSINWIYCWVEILED